MSDSLSERLRDDAFTGYAYAYPHKTAYRPFDPTVQLKHAWKDDSKDSLFLYVHIPFCEMRCGFCNLFTYVQPKNEFVTHTLQATERQSQVVADAIQPARVSQLAFGGGTPSYLDVRQIEQLLRHLESTWPIDWTDTQTSFETSPATIDNEKLALLKSYHVDRISMGVQSFVEQDLKQLGRPQANRDVMQAIELIDAANFSVFNLDLIYGVEDQSEESWMATVEQTINVNPDEIYLYPLYVRQLTGLERTGKSPSAQRRKHLKMAADRLIAAGYQQMSMRLFRRQNLTRETDYCCQDDGMVGLGPGARSYTRSLHYSSDYAVGQSGVKKIVQSFNSNQSDNFAEANFGFWLDEDEQRRRYVIKSLLRSDGLNFVNYERRFGSRLYDDFPQLCELPQLELAVDDFETLTLTKEGFTVSDVIGPWLYSNNVQSRMREYEAI